MSIANLSSEENTMCAVPYGIARNQSKNSDLDNLREIIELLEEELKLLMAQNAALKKILSSK